MDEAICSLQDCIANLRLSARIQRNEWNLRSIIWRRIRPGRNSSRAKNPSPVSSNRARFFSRPNGLKNPCNRYYFVHPGPKKEGEHAHRLCFRTSVNFLMEIERVIATIFQPGGRSEISTSAETHHVIRPLGIRLIIKWIWSFMGMHGFTW